MRTHLFVAAVLCAGNLFGQGVQQRGSVHVSPVPARTPVWRDMDAPAAAPSAPTPVAVRNWSAPTASSTAQPGMVVLGGIDWRFADPNADLLIGFNFSGVATSPLTRGVIVQLGAQQGLSAAEIDKIVDRIGDIDQVAISVRNNQTVALITGHVAETPMQTPEAGVKFVQLSANAILMGHTEAVNWAQFRMNFNGDLPELVQQAASRQRSSELWAIAAPGLAGPQAYNSPLRRIYLTVWLRERLISDVAFEFNGVPNQAMLNKFKSDLGTTTLEGNTAHIRMSMESSELNQKLAQIRAGALGQPLAALIEAARSLPAKDTSVPKRTKPVIYGLDDGPREVH